MHLGSSFLYNLPLDKLRSHVAPNRQVIFLKQYCFFTLALTWGNFIK